LVNHNVSQSLVPGGLHARGPTTGAGATSACLRAARASSALSCGAAHGAVPGSSAPGAFGCAGLVMLIFHDMPD